MALRLKHWLGVVAIGLAFVAVWRLPIGFVEPREAPSMSPEELRHSALVRELQDTRTRLDLLRRAETLPSIAIERAVDGVSVIVPDHREPNQADIDRLHEIVRAEVRAGSPRDPELVVAYAYDGAEGETGLAVSQTFRVETYVGEQDGTPYCLQVVVTRPSMVGSQLRRDVDGRGWSYRSGSLLGPCGLYAKHGLPGPAIQEWLDNGGIDFALDSRNARTPEYLIPFPRRTLFGIRAAGRSLDLERCSSGHAEACASMFLDPDGVEQLYGVRRVPPIRNASAVVAGSVRETPFAREGWFLLGDLEREFGREAFARFWTSDAEVPVAFESAFGIDVGSWLVDWVDEGTGVERPNPAPSFPATFASLLIVSLLTGYSTLRQRGRRVA